MSVRGVGDMPFGPFEEPSYPARYLQEAQQLLAGIDPEAVDRLAYGLAGVHRGGGRLFCLGLGGSAAHASHAAADFRKTCGFEAYAPADHVAAVTASANDSGFRGVLQEWLIGSRLGRADALLIFSTSGASPALVQAVAHALQVRARVFALLGADGGLIAANVPSGHVVRVPLHYPTRMTPHVEGLMAVLWHCLISHPALKVREFAWEGRQP